MSGVAPLSIVLPKALRERLTREARKRGLPLSTAVRMLVVERVREIDEAAELSAADQWQRAQAWSEWEKLRAGDVGEVTRDELERDFEQAIARGARRSRKRT
jgi:hypothetical protein